MNTTPRLRSAFPQTPASNTRWRTYGGDARQSYPSPESPFPSRATPTTRSPQTPSDPKPPHDDTLIPLSIIDAPTQRLYIAALYVALGAWRLYDFWNIQDDLDSTWLFLKWIGFDAAFFVGLPAFRVPWLEWSFVTTFTIWLLHVIGDFLLMYQIPLPLSFWFWALVKFFYNREAGLSSDRVNPALIRSNASIILGKQIIEILPEGSAVLNPDRVPLCLNDSKKSVEIPLQINQTQPVLIELLRIDLDTLENETLVINAKQARQLKRQADKGFHKSDTNTPRTLRYETFKTGLYQLLRVVDKSGLEVRKRSIDTAVVSCPQASVHAVETNRCTGELSNVALQVNGVPPFKVKYSKRINRQQFSSITQSIQPADLESPLGLDQPAMVVLDPSKPYLDWTNSRSVSVEINESLNKNGTWTYSVEEVEDGFGNCVSYDVGSTEDGPQKSPQRQSLTVHNRPQVKLVGCDSEHPLRVPAGDIARLPVRVRPPGQLAQSDWPLKLHYSYMPEDPGLSTETEVFEMADDRSMPAFTRPGRYSIDSIHSQYCSGEVNEPSTCVLFNPPQPDLSVEAEDIVDKCAGSPIGLLLNLDFTGTPPFKVRYVTTHQGTKNTKVAQFNGLRGQIELRENAAGSYKYQFLDVEDDVYAPVSLRKKNLILQQDIRPPASATFLHDTNTVKACLGEAVALNVKFVGEGPWKLDYEIVHNGRRKKSSVASESDVFSISLPELNEGGRQSVVLTAVQDKSGCRTPIHEERVIEVRSEQPQASFGDINGQRSVLTLEGKSIRLPLRLKGFAPWAVTIANVDRPSEEPKQHILKDANAFISVSSPGTYEIQSVHDSCPGTVDLATNTFKVSLVARPSLSIEDTSIHAIGGNTYQKPAVCQGDEDTFRLALNGHPPYSLKYQQRSEPLRGSHAVINRPLNIASSLALINLDTSRAGEYTYTFTELSDDRYEHDKRSFEPIIVKQQVYPLPSAKFSNPGKTYGYCKDDPTSGSISTETIPIILEGTPPFSLEIAITHHGSPQRPEIIRIKEIAGTSYSWSPPRASQGLELGTHAVTLRSVTDSRGCSRDISDTDPSRSVRVMVSDPPTIIPLESQTSYCVGDHVSFSLSGQPPFEVFYRFQDRDRRAKVPTTDFRRLAEAPGEFSITAISDSASGKCRAEKNITKFIHPMPSVKISKGKVREDRIQEGGEVEILFEFTGTPPFEFTYGPPPISFGSPD